MADIKITSKEPNLYVPIVMGNQENGRVLQQGESITVTDIVWSHQIIAQELFRDGKVSAVTV